MTLTPIEAIIGALARADQQYALAEAAHRRNDWQTQERHYDEYLWFRAVADLLGDEGSVLPKHYRKVADA